MAAGIAAGLCRVGSPAVNTSMMRMVEPQHGHGLRAVDGSSAAASSGSGAGGATVLGAMATQDSERRMGFAAVVEPYPKRDAAEFQLLFAAI
jgi:hypothetical protein